MSSELAPSCCSLMGLQVQAGVAGDTNTCGRAVSSRPHRGLPLGCERLGGSLRARRAAECQSQEARRARRCGTAKTALWHCQDHAVAPPGRRYKHAAARRLVELGAGRDPSGDGVVLAQVVEREADDGLGQWSGQG